jgi:hypothetical protein
MASYVDSYAEVEGNPGGRGKISGVACLLTSSYEDLTNE